MLKSLSFAVLVVIETTDVLFAVDSIPAVLSISSDPGIAYTSNVFAILGLRALYFALAEAMARFQYLSLGLGACIEADSLGSHSRRRHPDVYWRQNARGLCGRALLSGVDADLCCGGAAVLRRNVPREAAEEEVARGAIIFSAVIST